MFHHHQFTENNSGKKKISTSKLCLLFFFIYIFFIAEKIPNIRWIGCSFVAPAACNVHNVVFVKAMKEVAIDSPSNLRRYRDYFEGAESVWKQSSIFTSQLLKWHRCCRLWLWQVSSLHTLQSNNLTSYCMGNARLLSKLFEKAFYFSRRK